MHASRFRTAPLALSDWLVCAAVGSTVIWAMELRKLATRRPVPPPRPAELPERPLPDA